MSDPDTRPSEGVASPTRMIREHHLGVTRTARYHALGDPRGRLREVWMVCHGYGQLAAPFLGKFETLDDGSVLVVAPEALSRFYLEGGRHGPDSQVGASWMTREDRLIEIDDYVGYLDALHDAVFAEVGREQVRFTVLGFSQGTATVSRWAIRGKARVDRLVLWAGLLPPELEPGAAAAKLNALDLVFVAGDGDEHVNPARLAEQRASLDQAGVRYHLLTFAGGHRIDADALRQLQAL
jgi:predicted esterase